MNKKKQTIILICVFVIILISFILVSVFSGKIHKNESGTTGNTASNLYNNGLFCEHDGKVYFSNPSDNYSLYVMNTDESGQKCIRKAAARSINCDGKRLYYAQSGKSTGSGLGYIRKTTGMYSCRLNGSSVLSYTFNPIGIVALSGNKLLYQKYDKKVGTTLYSINIDKTDEVEIWPEYIAPACNYFSTMYYGGVSENHYLYAFDPIMMTQDLVWEHNLYCPVYHDDGWVYFIDLETEYELHRYNPSTDTEETLATDRVDFFNVIGNIVYYSVSSGNEPGLKRVITDGSAGDLIVGGIYENLNTTSKYLYFNEYGHDDVIYHMPHNDPSSLEIFNTDK